MKEESVRKLELLHKMARLDPEYRKLQNRLVVLEDEFDEIVSSLSEKEQEIVWAFVFAHDQKNLRMTEIALQFMDLSKYFKEEKDKT